MSEELNISPAKLYECVQNISTPIITAKLVQDDSRTSARVVKAKIEKTTLGQVRRERPQRLPFQLFSLGARNVKNGFNVCSVWLKSCMLFCVWEWGVGGRAPESDITAVEFCLPSPFNSVGALFRRPQTYELGMPPGDLP